jgi:hypothetical protein
MENFTLNTRDPLHARAYLAAAAHFLCGWPQEWNAETLAMALLSDDEDESPHQENKKRIKLWNAAKQMAASDDMCPYLKTDELICDLAESFILFLKENQS